MPCFSFVYRTAHWPRNSYVNSVPTQRRTTYHKHILYTQFRSTHFSHNLWNTYTNVNTNISTVSLYSPLFFCRMPQKVSLSAAKTRHKYGRVSVTFAEYRWSRVHEIVFSKHCSLYTVRSFTPTHNYNVSGQPSFPQKWRVSTSVFAQFGFSRYPSIAYWRPKSVIFLAVGWLSQRINTTGAGNPH